MQRITAVTVTADDQDYLPRKAGVGKKAKRTYAKKSRQSAKLDLRNARRV